MSKLKLDLVKSVLPGTQSDLVCGPDGCELPLPELRKNEGAARPEAAKDKPPVPRADGA